ncbi:hypothetical protein HDU98_009485 [Podochytrium sp. JEL0797]|nr:hypothetical protein HDU98_009485 [Podochytrium sp. JEL0797]
MEISLSNPSLEDKSRPDSNLGEKLLQRYRDGDSISNFFRNLTFDFSTSLQDDQPANTPLSCVTQELVHTRIKYHRMKESIRDQVVWVAMQLRKLHQAMPGKKPACIGFLLSDIFPETGESDCKVIIHALLKAASANGKGRLFDTRQIVILGRRDHMVSWVDEEHPGVRTVVEWERNPKATEGIDLLVILGSAIHITLVEEQLRSQNLSKIILMPVIAGIPDERLTSLLATNMVISPYWNFDEYHSSDREPQNITWITGAMAKGASSPSLGSFRQVCHEYCRRHKLDEVQINIIMSRIPTTEVASVEEFQNLCLPRHDPALG